MIVVGIEVVVELGERIAVGDHLGTMIVRRRHHVMAANAGVIEDVEMRLLEADLERRVIEDLVECDRWTSQRQQQEDHAQWQRKMPAMTMRWRLRRA